MKLYGLRLKKSKVMLSVDCYNDGEGGIDYELTPISSKEEIPWMVSEKWKAFWLKSRGTFVFWGKIDCPQHPFKDEELEVVEFDLACHLADQANIASDMEICQAVLSDYDGYLRIKPPKMDIDTWHHQMANFDRARVFYSTNKKENQK
jgi:hypothetical protein